jgi:DNA-binding transcriptional regulator YiaG
MTPSQNLANEISEIDVAVKAATPFVMSAQQQLWIDYNALSGIVTDITEDQSIRKMPITEFAEKIGVSRETLRQWRTMIPDFWDRVNKRREELAPQSRVQAFHEKWYVSALKMNNWAVSEAWARNFVPGYKEAKTKVEHELGNSWTALAQGKKEVIEGEVVDESKTS